MAPRHRDAVSIPRVLLMWSVLLASAVGVLVGVRALPGTPLGIGVAVVVGALVTPILASPWEWLVHRYVYHRPVIPALRRIYSIHLAHHHLYFPTWRYVTTGPPKRIPIVGRDPSQTCTSSVGNALTRGAHFAFYFALGIAVILLPGWLITWNVAFLVGATLSLALISNLFVTVHDAIHRPESHRLLQKQPWFRFLDEHHYIHHVDDIANVNFLLPLADLLFGTLRTSLTPEELRTHGPRARAKAHLEGRGEPAARVGPSSRPRQPQVA